MLSKIKPVAVHYGFDGSHESEGRITSVEFKSFVLVNTYVPVEF